jgi:hypothetical protein
MKILISESQLNRLFEESGKHSNHVTPNSWAPEEKEKIKMDTMIKAMQYPDMQSLHDGDRLTHSRVRTLGLEDICFPDRKKYRKRNEAINPEMVKYHAQFYKTKSDFYAAEPSLCAYAEKIGIINHLFPEKRMGAPLKDSPESEKRKQSSIDAMVHRAASAYRNPEHLKNDNPNLYKNMEDMGHFDSGLKYTDDDGYDEDDL